ncbi:MAG: crossover junction endodeoxyribonuclease RuvC, partial [bacterium]|nr:crossover junction endodeoxyribonuclease RuvC [bacterium]
MKVLGIDPGIERLGWGLIEKKDDGIGYLKSGVKKTLKTESQPARLLEIQNFLEELLARERPEVAAVERLFFSKNAKTALQVGEVRGVILAAAEKAGVA